VYVSNSVGGFFVTGLWRMSLGASADPRLIPGEANGVFNLVGYARQLSDGKLYYLYATTSNIPETYIPLAMYRAEADGVTGQTQLRTDAYVPREVLWSPDGSGAVIIDITQAIATGNYPDTGPLLYLKSDGSPAVPLIDNARLLRWGK